MAFLYQYISCIQNIAEMCKANNQMTVAFSIFFLFECGFSYIFLISGASEGSMAFPYFGLKVVPPQDQKEWV